MEEEEEEKLALGTQNQLEANHLDKDDNSIEDKENDDLDDIDGILKDLDNDAKNEKNVFVSPKEVVPDQLIKQVEEDILKQPDPNFFSKELIWCDDNFIIVKGHWNNEVRDCFMINIYGPQESAAKSSLWNRLAEFMNQHNGKFILFGDLNTVLHEYKRPGSLFSRIEAEHFNAFLDSTGLIDLPIRGRHFTWMNKAGKKLSKLDCFLISEGVMEDIPDIKFTVIERLWSDYSPILLHSKKADFGPLPFKLYNSWLSGDGFDDIVKSTWDYMEMGNGSNKISSHVKLRNLKNAIKKWQVDVRKIERSHKSANLSEIHDIEKKIDDGSASISDREKRIKLLQDIDKLKNLEALDLIQKARIKWDIEGDENSKFFYGIINSKRRTQAIACILYDGDWITELPLIKDVFLNYYKDKFQTHDSQVIFTLIANSPILCHHDRDFLESHISLDEKYWDLIKMDIFEFVNSFFASGYMPQGANSSFFTLISKISNSLSVKDFRPISLIGNHYKIISKLLANRLSKVIDKVVNKEQSAFIAGRQILDGPLIISEIIQWYKKRKKKMLIFKVDFKKAFDSVSWKYMDFILDSLGFGFEWQSWIRACLHYSRASIFINDSPAFESLLSVD
nr:putative RNA-directed DNA polymerase, eukaryota, reverse transcriptase zinc-binding domain protein [Tanacetum cinerariifolium]